MSTEQPEGGDSYLWYGAGGLTLYCIVLTAITGNIGFDGDDWWVLSLPYWNTFRDSLVLYAHKFLRPVEGLYWISLFELFGFNKVAFHLCSLLLLAGSAVLMGISLNRAFPGRRDCVSIATLLAFFLPTISCLTYVMFTDNSRLSMLLFWGSVLAFQRWAGKSSPWHGLGLPVALYVVSFLTYEAASFLIFLTPLLVWPVHRRCSGRPSDRAFLIRLCAGIMTAFVAAVAVRFVFLSGGAVGHSFLLPPLELLWSYLALLPFYLLAPFTSMSADRWALLAGFTAMVGGVVFFFFSSRGLPAADMADKGRFEPGSQWYLVVLGGGILVLGMLPYQLAGYGSFSPRIVETVMVKHGLLPEGDLSWFNFNWASRIYCSASFGVAILLAVGLSAWRKSSVRLLGKATALVLIGFMAIFHAGLSLDWREAAGIRNDLIRSLTSQVPAVKSGTNFLFVDVDCNHKRAEVIRRWNGLRELVGMLYADQALGAWYVCSYAYDPSTHTYRQAAAMPAGFLTRGQRQPEPASHDSLLLFKRSGRKLVLLDKIAAQDGSVPTGIEWQGVEHLTSNFRRIESWGHAMSPEVRLSRTAWTSSLFSALQLTQFRPPRTSLRSIKRVVVHDGLRPRVFKMRLHLVKPHL